MRPLSTESFLERAKSLGVGYHPTYPRSLVFLPPNDASRFWTRPAQASRWPHFVAALLPPAECGTALMVFPQDGVWPPAHVYAARAQHNRTAAVLFEALGVPTGWTGAIEFGPEDRERAIALLVIQLLLAQHDLYVLPSDGQSLLLFSHHEVVHVYWPAPELIDAFVASMAAARYPLPDRLPDATFKRLPWMRPANGTT